MNVLSFVGSPVAILSQLVEQGNAAPKDLVQALGSMRGRATREATAILGIALLRHKAPRVRLAAIEALTYPLLHAPFLALGELAEKDPAPAVRKAARAKMDHDLALPVKCLGCSTREAKIAADFRDSSAIDPPSAWPVFCTPECAGRWALRIANTDYHLCLASRAWEHGEEKDCATCEEIRRVGQEAAREAGFNPDWPLETDETA